MRFNFIARWMKSDVLLHSMRHGLYRYSETGTHKVRILEAELIKEMYLDK